ncbi:MAG: enoyl-CoA hydratase/isomerase family protein, partial [bacterium]|nr:enoyl-CoA hydratase/isomerase family protein [bacterium]
MKTDYQTIQVELRDHVAVFTMNNPPVNQLSAQFRADLAEALNEAYGDEGVNAIVLTGIGKNFIAGADITEIQRVKNKEELVAGMMEG